MTQIKLPPMNPGGFRKTIYPQHCVYIQGAFTELAEPASASDTVIKVVDASGFDAGSDLWYRQILAICDYVDEDGILYEGYNNYTRWVTGKTNSIVSVDTAVSPHVIRLAAPLGISPSGGGQWPVGQKVRQGRSGATYNYVIPSANVTQVPSTYNGRIAGLDYSGTNITRKFRPGTAFVRPGLLASYWGDDGPMLAWGMQLDKIPTFRQDGMACFLDKVADKEEARWAEY